MIELIIILFQIIVVGFTYGAFLSFLLLLVILVVFYFTSITFTLISISIVFILTMILKFKK
mgnify:CR=1 FL=1